MLNSPTEIREALKTLAADPTHGDLAKRALAGEHKAWLVCMRELVPMVLTRAQKVA